MRNLAEEMEHQFPGSIRVVGDPGYGQAKHNIARFPDWAKAYLLTEKPEPSKRSVEGKPLPGRLQGRSMELREEIERFAGIVHAVEKEHKVRILPRAFIWWDRMARPELQIQLEARHIWAESRLSRMFGWVNPGFRYRRADMALAAKILAVVNARMQTSSETRTNRRFFGTDPEAIYRNKGF